MREGRSIDKVEMKKIGKMGDGTEEDTYRGKIGKGRAGRSRKRVQMKQRR